MALPTSLPDLTVGEMIQVEKKAKQKGTPRVRVTAPDARKLAFIGTFPGADSEAVSVLANREESNFHSGGVLPTVKGTENSLRKLKKLEALDSYRQPSTGVTSYSLTRSGFDYARSYLYDMDCGATLNNISERRVDHYRMIAHVAAQFMSPQGYFEESLGISPVAFENVVSEHAMRAAYEPIKEMLLEQKEKGKKHDFAQWREARLDQAKQLAKDRKIDRSEILDYAPELLTLGHVRIEGVKPKGVYQPDMAVKLDSPGSGVRSQNLLVEIELSKKSWAAYDQILQTIKHHVEQPWVYGRAVYFTIGNEVGNLLRKVDHAGQYGLFESKRLVVLPLKHRDGSLVQLDRRIRLGGN